MGDFFGWNTWLRFLWVGMTIGNILCHLLMAVFWPIYICHLVLRIHAKPFLCQFVPIFGPKLGLLDQGAAMKFGLRGHFGSAVIDLMRYDH